VVLHVVLYRPEIPGNTGNAIRLSANTGATLHLVGPLGFDMDDAKLRRAGLDYHEYATVQRHETLETVPARRLVAFTARADARHDDVAYADGDGLLFGPEATGLPDDVVAAADVRVRIPMRPGVRSLNLSNAVAIGLYEAWRQLGYAGAA
jgi:tRNA (cytidine/uridine-2'-O-)-methyltransferase